MLAEQLKQRGLETELSYSASRSSGPGGQNVNKVNTKVELRFNVNASQILTEEEKALISKKLANKITADGDLLLIAQTERSQLKNKWAVTERFFQLLATALTPPKKRRPTKRTKASVEKRLDNKKKLSQKKTDRNFRL